ENNLTQTELSKKLGTTQQAISRLEKNLINPSLEFLVNSLYEMGYEISINKIKK
ncbi:MAG: helix-turn-helix domain-containing protein, partial [Fusobacteriaceae bacterium]